MKQMLLSEEVLYYFWGLKSKKLKEGINQKEIDEKKKQKQALKWNNILLT
jgi:hypothetical protein